MNFLVLGPLFRKKKIKKMGTDVKFLLFFIGKKYAGGVYIHGLIQYRFCLEC